MSVRMSQKLLWIVLLALATGLSSAVSAAPSPLESSIVGVPLDTRPVTDGVREVTRVSEMLPLAYSNDKAWSRGGLTAGETAVLVATPLRPVKLPDGAAYLSNGPSNLLASVAGEGSVSDWATTGSCYRVTLRVGDELRDEVLFVLSGVSPATLTMENAAVPVVGSPLTLTLQEDAGSSPLRADWTRVAADGTRTALASGEERYVPVTDDYGHWIEAKDVERPDYALRLWFSRLPVAYVTTSTGENPTSKTVDLTGTFRLQGNGQWQKAAQLYDGELEKIHVRGNSTAGYPKKPYKIKLGKKANLLGMGSNKHWVLLANYQDPGLMRNKAASDLSGELGLTYMASEWVDVVVNGEFAGNYQLCEHIRIGKDRIDIPDWEDTAKDTATELALRLVPEEGAARDALARGLTDSMTANLAWITSGRHTFTNGVTYTLGDYGIDVSSLDLSGGYVYELDEFDDEPSRFRVTSGILSNLLVKVNSPETLATNGDLLEAQKTLWAEFFASVQSENGYANGRSWAECGDVKSMAAYWLVQALFTQQDMRWSRFAYRPRQSPLVFGPVWDFDNAVGGRCWTWTVSTNDLGEVSEIQPAAPTGWRDCIRSDNWNFYGLWVDDPYFCLVLHELWQDRRDVILDYVKEDGRLDGYYDYLLESGRANDRLWPVQTKGNAAFPFEGTNGNAKVMIRYLRAQFKWIDRQMASLRTLVASLKSKGSDHPYADSADRLKMEFPGAWSRIGSPEGETPDVLVLAGTNVTGTVTVADADTATVEVYVNGRAVSTNAVTDGAVAYAVPMRFLTAETGHRNLVALLSRNGAGTLLRTTYALVEKTGLDTWPLVADDLVVTVDVHGHDPGDPLSRPVVTVTTTNGVALVEGRDYDVRFDYAGADTANAVVTGSGSLYRRDLAEGQVNFVGTKTVAFAVDPVVARADGAAALDVRPFRPCRILSAGEVLPFAYDTSWWPNASAVSAITVTPLTNGVVEAGTARESVVAVTNTVGTGLWSPTHREVYRAEIRPTGGDAWTVDLDLTGATNLVVMGVQQANGDLLFADLADARRKGKKLTLPHAWLSEHGVDRAVARDTARNAANGLPVWESFVLGLNPQSATSILRTDLVQTAGYTFRVEVRGLDEVRQDLVDVVCELWSTTNLGQAFELYEGEQAGKTFPGLPMDDPLRFYKVRAKIYWK